MTQRSTARPWRRVRPHSSGASRRARRAAQAAEERGAEVWQAVSTCAWKPAWRLITQRGNGIPCRTLRHLEVALNLPAHKSQPTR